MEGMILTRAGLALAFVLALIWGLAWLAQRFGLDKKLKGISGAKAGRMAVQDVLYLDPKRKIMLLRIDDREVAVLLSGDRATLLSTAPVLSETPHA